MARFQSEPCRLVHLERQLPSNKKPNSRRHLPHSDPRHIKPLLHCSCTNFLSILFSSLLLSSQKLTLLLSPVQAGSLFDDRALATVCLRFLFFCVVVVFVFFFPSCGATLSAGAALSPSLGAVMLRPSPRSGSRAAYPRKYLGSICDAPALIFPLMTMLLGRNDVKENRQSATKLSFKDNAIVRSSAAARIMALFA